MGVVKNKFLNIMRIIVRYVKRKFRAGFVRNVKRARSGGRAAFFLRRGTLKKARRRIGFLRGYIRSGIGMSLLGSWLRNINIIRFGGWRGGLGRF